MSLDVKALLMQGIREAIEKIEVDTAHGPPIVIDHPLEEGPPNEYLQWLKPKIIVYIKGQDPIVMKPYGEPGPSDWEENVQKAKTGAIVGGGLLAGVILWRLTRK